jgi:hypothetical protein
MVTTKRRVTTKTAILKFNPEWIKDPPPPFFKNLDRAVIREITAAKKQFEAQVKEILTRAQR